MDLALPIATERLILRRHEPRDRGAFVALVTDPRFYAHLTVPERQRTPEGAAEVFDLVAGSYETEEPVWGLTVADRATDAFVGTVALHPVPFGEALELFYAVVPERQGEGLAVEAVRALLHALPDRDLVARTPPDNEASARVARAAGMQDAGLERPLGGPERRRFVRPARA
ncbi:MAG: GNAT family N-acetyltransferase [Sandaracinaceae bacterium]|nr:GNAT family N-acetyltransferase [Sandaracinaceae bacterium]